MGHLRLCKVCSCRSILQNHRAIIFFVFFWGPGPWGGFVSKKKKKKKKKS